MLSDHIMDRIAEINIKSLVAGDFELTRVEAELMQDGRVDVGDVVPVFDGVKANLVRRAMSNSAL